MLEGRQKQAGSITHKEATTEATKESKASSLPRQVSRNRERPRIRQPGAGFQAVQDSFPQLEGVGALLVALVG